MAVIDSRTWMIHLSESECWRLLDEQAVGRVGVLVNSAPEVYPVNYRTDGRSVLFRTDPGSKLQGLGRSPSVCFEIDGLDPAAHAGWSVLVKGRARVLLAADERRAAAHMPLEGWSVGPKEHWVRIEPNEVTGRQILPGGKGRTAG